MGIVQHNIEITPHPNGRDLLVKCTCGFVIRALNNTDAARLRQVHIDAEREKEKASDH